MSIFDRFESAVERGVNGAFSRVFRSGIKPVDITTAIRRAMDESVQEVSASRIIAANHFSVYASRTDLTSLEASLDVLADEFAQQATEHASNNDYSLLGPVSIEFRRRLDRSRGHPESRRRKPQRCRSPRHCLVCLPRTPHHRHRR